MAPGRRQLHAARPPNPPVAQFWAITLYDTETRRFIDNEHEIAGLDSRMDLVKNADGSVDLYSGLKPPEGLEKNWIPTVPGKLVCIFSS